MATKSRRSSADKSRRSSVDKQRKATIFEKEIPLAGNAFVTVTAGPNAGTEKITNKGLQNWESSNAVISIYVWMTRSESIDVALRLQVPKGRRSTMTLALTQVRGRPVTGWIFEKSVEARDEPHTVYFGRYNIEMQVDQAAKGGYVKFDLKGVARTGGEFGEVSHMLFSYRNGDNDIVYNSQAMAYHGLRGPIGYLFFTLNHKQYTAEYFYNEVQVPPGYDPEGLYAVACGFTRGLFGIQVNGPSERRVLFSVWSDFKTPDPKMNIDDYKVLTIRKGEGAVVRDFGNKGSGIQAFVRVPWTSGTKYKFLVQCKPLETEHTLYTAWFQGPEAPNWMLVASFRKPKIRMYLQGLYCLLENVRTETGHLERRALYQNQWVRDTTGQWHELRHARFSGDEIAQNGRRDLIGGLDINGTAFEMRHCGFFSDRTQLDQVFTRKTLGAESMPQIDVTNLP